MIYVIVISMLGFGFVFLLGASIGMIRMPDAYSRAHASGLCDSLGVQACFVALAILNLADGVDLESICVSLKILLVAVFFLVTSPTATHAIFRGAYHAGQMPWLKANTPATTPQEAAP